MTIAKIGGFDKNTAARRSDRGGSIMNLVSEIFLKSDYNDSRKTYKPETDMNIDDYGYGMYKSLEYDFKYLKNDDFGFRGNSLNVMKK